MMRALGMVVGLTCLALPTFALAADLPLGLDDAALRAEEHSAYVRRARALLKVAQAKRVGAAVLQRSNPQVSLMTGRRHDSSGSIPPANGFEWDLHLEQRLELTAIVILSSNPSYKLRSWWISKSQTWNEVPWRIDWICAL